MKTKSKILSTGLAMFSMFFGSGNLVFPLVVGQMSDGHFTIAAIGILLTGVFVPFLGILVMLLFNGNSNEFFGRLGKPAVFWFSLVALSLMGPFGVLARCITVAHGAFKLVLPDTGLWIFSALCCGVIFLLTVKKNKIVPLLGSILTPILLISLAAIAVFSLNGAHIPTIDGAAWSSFKNGIFQGYQTMDLLAAFFFSTFVINHLKDQSKDQPHAFSIFIKSSLIGAALLSIVYVVLVILGAAYAPELASVPPQEMLAYVAKASLGSFAAPIVCCTMVLACITTAIVLASLFAEFLKKEIAKDKIGLPFALIITLAIAFVISTLEFSGIARILGPILDAIYPALIVMTVLGIFHKLWGWRSIKVPFAIAFLAKVLLRI
jgi:LIVCS family branched-chain amino acid:cation transporter